MSFLIYLFGFFFNFHFFQVVKTFLWPHSVWKIHEETFHKTEARHSAIQFKEAKCTDFRSRKWCWTPWQISETEKTRNIARSENIKSYLATLIFTCFSTGTKNSKLCFIWMFCNMNKRQITDDHSLIIIYESSVKHMNLKISCLQ